MKIAIDAGALAQKQGARFGTYTFSDNIIRAFLRYGPKDVQARLYAQSRLSSLPHAHIPHQTFVTQPFLGWMQTHVLLRELLHPSDTFLALNQAFPAIYRGNIITFSHGLSFLKYPDMYPDHRRLMRQLDMMVARAHTIFVTAKRVQRELKAYAPRATVKLLPVGVPHDMVKKQRHARKKAFLFVGMKHKIKNIEGLLEAFSAVRKTPRGRDWELWIVGSGHSSRGHGVRVWKRPTREQLRKLYAQAGAYVCASHYESLHFPYLEALAQCAPIIGMKRNMIDEIQPFAHTCAKDIKSLEGGMLRFVSRPTRIRSTHKLHKTFDWSMSAQAITSSITKAGSKHSFFPAHWYN